MGDITRILNQRDGRHFPAFSTLCRADYGLLVDNITLDARPEISRLLFHQTLTGHAGEGHVTFREANRSYPNVTMDDICLALGEDPTRIKEQRQRVIDEVFTYVRNAIEGNSPRNAQDEHLLANEQGQALAGLALPGGIPIIKNPLDVLRGMVLGSIVDDYSWRLKVTERYGTPMGGGACFLIDYQTLLQQGLTIRDLANSSDTLPERVQRLGIHTNGDTPQQLTTKLVDHYVDRSIIVPGDNLPTSRRLVNGYLRFASGKGISDDTAFITAGVFFGMDFAWGVYLADAVDTWDKFVPTFREGGWDHQLGVRVRDEFSSRGIDLGFTEDDMINFLHNCAKNRYGDRGAIPDSSQRYFLQKDDLEGGKSHRRQLSALRSHIGFIRQVHELRQYHAEHGSFPPHQPERRSDYVRIVIGSSRISNLRFYDALQQHYMRLIESGQLKNPDGNGNGRHQNTSIISP